ncbi:MAG: hypothetical protein KatS3mg057_0832 [Herpetosiphonaceae bacterium]|nr:MAG: hypothetical protein KatS3mg057_0832 [Herpetosiphonaceae bacterium]
MLCATPLPAGSVRVVVRRVEQGSRDAVELLVGDTGPGVDPALREHIWERGIRGSDGGSGLGLSIVREIALAHGGEARLLDAGPGALFSLLLPAFTSVHRLVIREQ